METFETAKDRLLEKFENYSKTSIELAKLNAIDKTADVVSSLSSLMCITIVASMFVLFINIALSLYVGKLLGEYFLGFLIVSSFYLIVGIIIYISRQQLIKTPVSNMILGKLLKRVDLNKIINQQ
jgi:hypothetical protein